MSAVAETVLPQSQVTLAAEAIHNPAEARHFMRLKPVGRRVRILWGTMVLAETSDAVRLLEVGKDFYDPMLYIPRAGVRVPLREIALNTHCPLKGDAIYFDLPNESGATLVPKIAWSYPEPFDFASGIAERIAFDPSLVTIEESPL